MPLYDFHCPHCDTQTELLVRASDTPACAACGTLLERLVGLTAPQLCSKGIAKAARAQAAREGHLSNF
jgi:putative FmdB family regulatory protein